MLSDTNPLPLYAQLAELLRQRISRSEWKIGERLPSQDELSRTFAVARVTVRQAIALLEKDGLLLSKQGKGTFVQESPGAEHRLHVQTTLQALVSMLEGDVPQLLNIAENATAPRLSDKDGVAARDYIHMRRVHLRQGTPYCIISVYLDKKIFSRDPERFRRDVVIPILAAMPDVKIAHAHQTLTIGVADPDTASHLGISIQAPVANVRRVFRDPEGTVIYLGEVTYRGDLVQLEMNLSS